MLSSARTVQTKIMKNIKLVLCASVYK